MLSGCGAQAPREPDNICAIFRQYPDWYEAAWQAERKWAVPVPVQLAIIHQESAFVDDARPPRRRLLWIIPWTRGSSAYGYAQAQDDTWDWYIRKTDNSGADRDDIDDALDFVGWYVDTTHRMTGVARHDAYRNYLAYHEGQGGYRRGTYRNKDWLLQVAAKVERRAKRYASQLGGCRAELEEERTSWWPF